MTTDPLPAPHYAGFGRRFAAFVLDWLFLTFVTGVYALLGGGGTLAALLGVALALGGLPQDIAGVVVAVVAVTVVTVVVGAVLIHGLYWVLLTGLAGATLGKLALGLRVVDEAGGRPGLARAFMREVPGKFVSKSALFLGYFWVLKDGRKQAWHDKIAGTYVLLIRP